MSTKNRNAADEDGCIRKVVMANWTVENETQSVMYYEGDRICLPREPKKDGYVFAGWNPDVPNLMPDHDLKFTAVFKKSRLGSGSDIQNITVECTPEKTVYACNGKSFDPSGFVLKVTYFDGSCELISDASKMAFEGFDNSEPGYKTIKVKYKNKTVSFTVFVKKTFFRRLSELVFQKNQ